MCSGYSFLDYVILEKPSYRNISKMLAEQLRTVVVNIHLKVVEKNRIRPHLMMATASIFASLDMGLKVNGRTLHNVL